LKWRGTVWRRWLCEQKRGFDGSPGGRPNSVARKRLHRCSFAHSVRVHRPTSHGLWRIDRRDRSPSGPAPRTWRFRRNRPTPEACLGRPSPRYNPGYCLRTSRVGTDLRAVRHCGPGAFGEIALPRKRAWEGQVHGTIPDIAREPPG
jgi:hypothetical protein